MNKKRVAHKEQPLFSQKNTDSISDIIQELQEKPLLKAFMREAIDCPPHILKACTEYLKERKSHE